MARPLRISYPGAFYHVILVEIDGYAKELSRYLHFKPGTGENRSSAGGISLVHLSGFYPGLFRCQKYARMKLKDIGAYFGVGESGVCQAARRVTERMKMDRRLTKRIDAMEKRF